MSSRVTATAALGTVVLASSLSLACRSGDSESAIELASPAAQMHAEGLDAFSRWDERAMFARMQAAWTSDPAFIPAILDLHEYYSQQVRLPTDVRSALDSIVRSDPEGNGICAAFVLAQLNSFSEYELPVANVDPTSEHPCVLFARIRAAGDFQPNERIAVAERLWRRYPNSLQLADDYLVFLGRAQNGRRVLDLTDALSDVDRHPLLRALAFGWRVGTLHSLGRLEESAAVELEAEAQTRLAEPGIRRLYLDALGFSVQHWWPPRDDPRWPGSYARMLFAQRERLRLLDRADLINAIVIRMERGKKALDDGELTESLSHWDWLVAKVDTLPTGYQALVYMRRGRALSKLGRLREAEAPLLAARETAARLHRGNYRAVETEHNLLHVYESLGWDDEADSAGRAFVAFTRQMPELRPVRMMSYHDYGMYLQLRGQHEAARRMFEAMIAACDSLGDTSHWIGEYYELIGDMGRAFTYYRRVWDKHEPDVVRSLVALTRISEATGDDASALYYARAHDEFLSQGMKYPESSPLVPGVLARSGQVEAAIVELQRNREAAFRRGQAAAWARLTLEQAELEAGRGNLLLAIELADSAAAESVGTAAVTLRARAFSALKRASLDAEDCSESIAVLRQSAADAERARIPQIGTDVQLMLGDALATTGDVDAALVAYSRAAVLSDSLAASLSHDVVRAGFRAEQLFISDHALAAVLSHAASDSAPARYASWSIRRKSPGISIDASAARALAESEDAIRRIQSRLDDESAVIDYVVHERGAAALLVTRDDAHIVELPTERETLGARASALVAAIAPRLGSYVDLSRSRFDTATARQLYLDLVAPLEPYLVGRKRLTVVPDAPLQIVPFDALVTSGANEPPAQLLDRYTVSMVTSLADRAANGERITDGAVIAVATPGSAGNHAAEREIEAIARARSASAVVRLQGSYATESAVRSHSRNAAVLHFAAHAQPNAVDPDFARIDLVAEGEDDGLLHAYEIRQLQLPGSLVILSACESAAGRMVAGAGPLSLSRAFLQAGAGGVVGTLWPVGDEAAAEFMTAFHGALARGMPPAEALGHAKRSLRATRPDSFYWAPFVLVSPGL